MQELEANADSVHFLITELCCSIARKHGVEQRMSVTKLKAQSFEILLKKSAKRTIETDENIDPHRALDVQIFAAKLNAYSNPVECAKVEAYDKHLAFIEDHQYFRKDAGKQVLQLLLELQGNNNNAYDAPHTPCLLVPGPFTLHASYLNNQHYPAHVSHSVKLTEPKFFQGLRAMQTCNNPYLPKFLIDGEPNMLARIKKKFAPAECKKTNSNNNDVCSFTGMTQRLWGGAMRIDAKAFGLFADNKDNGLFHQEEQRTKNKDEEATNKVRTTAVSTTATETAASAPQQSQQSDEDNRVFSWNWENLGNFGIICSKPFASESDVALHLQCVHLQALGESFEAKIVTQQQFLKDLKSLTVGLQSDTFSHDEYIIFSMKSNITVDGLLPATINNFVSDFVECGTCYKRMQTMIMKRDYKLMFEGFMFKAICSAIDEYLITFRQYVFSQDDVYLMQFYKRMKTMMKQIVNLSFTLAIHPSVEADVKPPMGSQFLGYLYNEITRLTEKDYITLLVFILKRCCHVYFKHLQKWIFYGLLDDPSNELFVGFVDHYRPNTKYYYDKAYFLRRESVPGFFQNFEDQILQCGKYMMLLKSCKPNHPLFELDYPAISVCLTFDEIQSLETVCFKYFERAREICGKPITIREIFEARIEGRRNFLKMVSQRSRENMEKWTEEQHALAVLAAERKRKRLEELITQLEVAKQRKIDDRRANVELELKSLKEAKQMESRSLLCENINLRKRLEYYQELSDIMQSDADEAAQKKLRNKLIFGVTEEETLPKKQTPRTPGSNNTDFLSCEGDEDEESVYAECISDDFVLKFEASEEELHALCGEQQQQENNNLDSKANSDTEVIREPAFNTNIKRSASDYLNSNELPALVMTVMQKNRERALSGSIMQECVMNTKPRLKVPSVNTKMSPLTEAQRNKLKILSNDYTQLPDAQIGCYPPDANLNTMHPNSRSEGSELQRNRKRMMENDTFSEFNKNPLAERLHLNLELSDTDRSRNRRKVLESEFNILTGRNATSTTTFVVEEPTTPLTPMSTTSDLISPNVGDGIEQNIGTVTAPNKDDQENGNIEVIVLKPALRIDVVAAAAAEEQFSQDLHQTSDSQDGALLLNTAASQLSLTPEFALNTAGLMAKQGFDFHSEQLLEKNKQNRQQAAANEAPIQNSKLQELNEQLFPLVDYRNPYKRCMELIETNFQCATRSPYFRLNKPAKQTPLEASQSAESLRQSMDKQLNLNSMSVITLTEFLQKSITIPMNTHLEVLNTEVMRMFLDDLQVLSHFKSLRNYYFLMDGEFGAFICDGIIGKLEEDEATPEKLFNYQVLHSVLENALGSSIIGNDKNAVNLSFIVSDMPIEFDLTRPEVLDNLSLSYHVDWPLNLILSPETLEKYASIFNHLIKVRRISWVLERAYQILKEAVKQHGTALLKSPEYRHVQQIRHKFYHFVHALQNHITANALQASWKTFKDDLLSAKSLEDIYRKHAKYVKHIIFLCMLKRQSTPYYKTIENIFRVSLKFYNNLKARDFKIRSGDEYFTHPRYEILAADELEFDQQLRHVIYLGNKIVRHGYQQEIGEFISLINYNGYYT